MDILFLTLVRIKDISEKGIYTDLFRKFKDEGHNVYIVCPTERRYHEKTSLSQQENVYILNIKTPNVQKTNLLEKGIATILIEKLLLRGIGKLIPNVKFDLVVYSTPPITFTNIVKYFKKRDGAKSYLLLKDIFPQNAVDLGMLKKNGFLHSYFRKKEKELYHISDVIGCMSPANKDFVVKHNIEVNPLKVEVNPNSISFPEEYNKIDEVQIRRKYDIPLNVILYVYGGNLGKPQGIDFLIEVIESNKERKDCYFLIVGDGTEFNKLSNWFMDNKPNNAKLYSSLSKTDFDALLCSCDVGLIFLDKRFTIPNFPSRLLSYMENKLPVLLATDKNTDIGNIVVENNFGFWTESGNLSEFNKHINFLNNENIERKKMGENAYEYLKANYLVENSYQIIMNHFKNV